MRQATQNPTFRKVVLNAFQSLIVLIMLLFEVRSSCEVAKAGMGTKWSSIATPSVTDNVETGYNLVNTHITPR